MDFHEIRILVMIPGPVLRRELRAVCRPRDLLGIRTGLAVLLVGLVVGLTRLYQILEPARRFPDIRPLLEMTLATVVFVTLLVSTAFVVIKIGESLAEEREKRGARQLLISEADKLED